MAVSASAAVAYALLAHVFGRTVRTDGFLAAYSVYLALALAAQAFRVVVVPDLTRAAAAGRLPEEVRGYFVSFSAVAVPLCLLVALFRQQLGDLVTAKPAAAHVAAHALVWLVPAGFGQLLGAVAASALAARDDYGVAACAYALGAVANVALFAALAHTSGLISLAWGVALNAAVVLGIPLVVLVVREGMLSSRTGASLRLPARVWQLVSGAALPFALQGFFIVAQRLAAGIGVGRATTFVTAYLISAVLVAATASSVALISSAPLTRRGLDEEGAAAHVVHSSWLSLALIAAAAGVFALVGARLAHVALGSAYSGHAGHELGRLVVYLAPWMVATVAYTAAYPLLFVMERGRRLVRLAVVTLALHVPIALGLREALGLPGVCIALALSTVLVLAGLLVALSPRVLTLAGAGIAELSLVMAALALASFGIPSLVLGDVPAALVGLAVYSILVAALRPRGLRDAWAYVRALH